MAKRKQSETRWDMAQAVVGNMSAKDREQATKSQQFKTTVSLEKINDRSEDTRKLNANHVKALAESVRVLGLLEPLVVDNKFVLLAGGHRLAAIRQIKETDLDIYEKIFPKEQIPVRVMSFNANEEPELALQCEIAENEHRKDYTPKEVRQLAERLKAAGYVQQRGRPEKGTKALGPALEIIVGKHIRTVRRYLHAEINEDSKNRTNVLFLEESKVLQKILRSLEKWRQLSGDEIETPKRQSLAKKIPQLSKLISAAIKETDQMNENTSSS